MSPKINHVYLVAEGGDDTGKCMVFPIDLLRAASMVPFRARDALETYVRYGKVRILFRRFEVLPIKRADIVRNTMQLAPTFESYGWRIVGIYTAPDVAIAVTDFPDKDHSRRIA